MKKMRRGCGGKGMGCKNTVSRINEDRKRSKLLLSRGEIRDKKYRLEK